MKKQVAVGTSQLYVSSEYQSPLAIDKMKIQTDFTTELNGSVLVDDTPTIGHMKTAKYKISQMPRGFPPGGGSALSKIKGYSPAKTPFKSPHNSALQNMNESSYKSSADHNNAWLQQDSALTPMTQLEKSALAYLKGDHYHEINEQSQVISGGQQLFQKPLEDAKPMVKAIMTKSYRDPNPHFKAVERIETIVSENNNPVELQQMSTVYDQTVSHQKRNMDLPKSLFQQTQSTVQGDPNSLISSWHNGVNTGLISVRDQSPYLMVAEGKRFAHEPMPSQPPIQQKKEIRKLEGRKLSLPPIISQTSTELNSVELLNQLISQTSLNPFQKSPRKKQPLNNQTFNQRMRQDQIYRDKLKKISDKSMKEQQTMQSRNQLISLENREKQLKDQSPNVPTSEFSDIIKSAQNLEVNSSPQEFERNKEEFLTTLLNFIGQQTSSSIFTQQSTSPAPVGQSNLLNGTRKTIHQLSPYALLRSKLISNKTISDDPHLKALQMKEQKMEKRVLNLIQCLNLIDLKTAKFDPQIQSKENQILLDTVRSNSNHNVYGSGGQTETLSKTLSKQNIMTNFSIANMNMVSGTASPLDKDNKGLLRISSGQDQPLVEGQDQAKIDGDITLPTEAHGTSFEDNRPFVFTSDPQAAAPKPQKQIIIHQDNSHQLILDPSVEKQSHNQKLEEQRSRLLKTTQLIESIESQMYANPNFTNQKLNKLIKSGNVSSPVASRNLKEHHDWTLEQAISLENVTESLMPSVNETKISNTKISNTKKVSPKNTSFNLKIQNIKKAKKSYNYTQLPLPQILSAKASQDGDRLSLLAENLNFSLQNSPIASEQVFKFDTINGFKNEGLLRKTSSPSLLSQISNEKSEIRSYHMPAFNAKNKEIKNIVNGKFISPKNGPYKSRRKTITSMLMKQEVMELEEQFQELINKTKLRSSKLKFSQTIKPQQKFREKRLKDNLTQIGPDGNLQIKYVFNDVNDF